MKPPCGREKGQTLRLSFLYAASGRSLLRLLPVLRGRGGRPSRADGQMFFFSMPMAFFSSRETCACEMPISEDTSIWVLP